ncbi:MAG: polysaccharide biosynthesis protein [Clostridia bacterium]|nr:polysaccharide biosynthesis protein [Clostridia bacterium]
MSFDDNSRKKFIGGVAVLTASTAAVKIIGLFYKIPLIQLVGIDGMAYFLAAYHIYTLLFTLSNAGLPVAVSILVSKSIADNDRSTAAQIYRVSLTLFTVIGAVSTAVLWFGADAIAESIEIPQASACIRAVSPALLLVSAGSAVKGYFQGLQNMKPTAVSQVIESVGKLGLGLLFTYRAISQNLPLHLTAAYAISGLTAGVVISTAYLFIIKLSTQQRETIGSPVSLKSRTILRKLAAISAPITLGAAIISVTSLTDTALISSRLQSAGFSPSVANAMYSSYGNLAIPIFNLVPAFISPIALSMAPMIAEAAQQGRREREQELLSSSFRLCSLIALPASLGISVFGKEILCLIFSDQAVAINIAAPLLSVLSPAIFFSCLITVTNAALQAYGKANRPIISMALGVSIKIISEFLLIGRPDVNILGAPISTLLCDLTIVISNLYFIKKYTCGTERTASLFYRSLSAATISTVLVIPIAHVMSKQAISGAIMMMSVISLDVLIYLFTAAKLGAVTALDLEALPKGEKLAKALQKIKLLK